MSNPIPVHNSLTTSKEIPNELPLAKSLVYDKLGFDCTNLKAEEESAEYAAFTFGINNKLVIYREAKITPTKIGQFVTIWKRKSNGPIEPFDVLDDFDLIIISTRHDDYFGQFIFPKAVLLNKGIISGNNKAGKRGIRVYPPWDKATNAQAIKTQQWQLEYFIDMSDEKMSTLLFSKAKTLLL